VRGLGARGVAILLLRKLVTVPILGSRELLVLSERALPSTPAAHCGGGVGLPRVDESLSSLLARQWTAISSSRPSPVGGRGGELDNHKRGVVGGAATGTCAVTSSFLFAWAVLSRLSSSFLAVSTALPDAHGDAYVRTVRVEWMEGIGGAPRCFSDAQTGGGGTG
jgi:hypothetical protein